MQSIERNSKKWHSKISALSSGKTDKYEYFTVEEILPPSQKIAIEQANLTYCPIGKPFEKQLNLVVKKSL